MKKFLAIVTITLLALTGIAWGSWQWFKWGPRPDIHVQGQVIDRANGHGVAEAYVILALRVSKSTYGGTHSGCAEGSAVVRTDQDGKFTYSITAREAFGPENPGGWGVTIYVYHPEFDAAAETGLHPNHMQLLASSRRPDGSWRERPDEIFMTFPHYYNNKEGWATIEVVKREISEWQHIEYFTSSPHNKCIKAPVDRGQSDLINQIHTRAWGLFCMRRADGEFNSNPDEPNGARMYYLFSSIFSAYLYDVRRNMTETQRSDIASKRARHIINSVLASYPRGEDDADFGRDMTLDERENFCAFHTPPLERILARFEQ